MDEQRQRRCGPITGHHHGLNNRDLRRGWDHEQATGHRHRNHPISVFVDSAIPHAEQPTRAAPSTSTAGYRPEWCSKLLLTALGPQRAKKLPRLADVQLNGSRPGPRCLSRCCTSVATKHHRQQASRQTDKREMPAENEAHKHQRCRIRQWVTHPEGKRRPSTRAVGAYPPPPVRRSRNTSCPAGEKIVPSSVPCKRSCRGFHQPVTRDKYLNQRAQQYAPIPPLSRRQK